MDNLTATTKDDQGWEICLSGPSLVDLAYDLSQYGDATLSATVYDDHGFVRGWVHGDGQWSAK